MKQPLKIIPPIRLKDFDTDVSDGLDKETAREKADHMSRQIGELQEVLNAEARRAVILLFQGMDTSGKDGAVRHVLGHVNPAGVQTANFKSPSAEELAHDYLWRIHKAVPRYGNIGVFNRSHYEDVLIVRVLNLMPKRVWKTRYDQINAFEKHLTENNIVLLKFFLHISKKEQAERLQSRLDNPNKNWKFEEGDLKMRARWKQFQKAYEDVLNLCSTKWAPWYIVPADHKWYRDYVIARVVLRALEELQLKWPKPKEDLSRFQIK